MPIRKADLGFGSLGLQLGSRVSSLNHYRSPDCVGRALPSWDIMVRI